MPLESEESGISERQPSGETTAVAPVLRAEDRVAGEGIEDARYSISAVSVWEKLLMGAAGAALWVFLAWQWPVMVAEERGHRRARGVVWLVWLGLVCPPLWVAAWVWAVCGRAGFP